MKPLVLVTGVTGYVGGRLLAALESRGHHLRCMARKPEAIGTTLDSTEVIRGDVLNRASLDSALSGVSAAYYLVHSMGTSGSFEEEDREAARNFAAAAAEAGVERIVYLGALGSDAEELSPHLKSRQEVGEILRDTGVPVIELRASIIIGDGSLSFEMIRSLVQRLPVMIAPKWVNVPAQPIAIQDVLEYLIGALELPAHNRVYEIGGVDRMSYADIMREYARQRGKRLRIISVPVLTPFLSSLWLSLVTPLYARVGRKLIGSITHATVVRDRAALTDFAVRPMSLKDAIRRAMQERTVS